MFKPTNSFPGSGPAVRRAHRVAGLGDPVRQLEVLLRHVQVVSFDLFDTLVHREEIFSPKDLFYRVQDLASELLGRRADDFAMIRIQAEGTARARAWGRRSEEVTLDEIYQELGYRLRLAPEALAMLKEIELNCERQVLGPLASGLDLFSRVLAVGKPAVIVSDTYFSEEFIREIVAQTDFGQAKKIFVSSALGTTKAMGSLYDHVIQDLGCRPSSLLHIGDNPRSDAAMALGRGARAILVPAQKDRLRWRYGLSQRGSGNLIISSLLCKLSEQRQQDKAHSSPQGVVDSLAVQLSVLYFGFAVWLMREFRRQGIRRVYFAARDGLVMKRFFDLVSAAAAVEFETRYLYVSRAALYPILIFTDPMAARRLFSLSWDHLSMDDALRRLSLNPGDGGDLLAEFARVNRHLPLNQSTSEEFARLLEQNWSVVERRNEERCRLVVDYFRQEMPLGEEKAAFVDIGWHGTLQNCLLHVFKRMGVEKELHGYYLGLFERPEPQAAGFRATAFLVDHNEPQWNNHLVRSSPSLIELLHGAGHGGVLEYERRGSAVVPVLDDNPEEKQQFQTIIAPLQEKALDLIAEQLRVSAATGLYPADPELVARVGLRMIHAPTLSEAEIFGRLKIATDFGGPMKSITGVSEWDLSRVTGGTLPDGSYPMWRSGFDVLKHNAGDARAASGNASAQFGAD